MKALYNTGLAGNNYAAPDPHIFSSISVHPEVQDGAPVFSGTRIRVETFFDYMRIGVSVTEFLNEFPSITRDQAMDVYTLVQKSVTVDQIAAMISGPSSNLSAEEGRIYAAA